MAISKVLIVANDPTLTQSLVEICLEFGFSTALALDGLNATLAMNRRNPDLILLDVDVPPVGSLPIFGHLVQSWRRAAVPILALVHKADKRAIRQHRILGTPMVLKPSNGQDDLRSQLCPLLKRHVTSWPAGD